MATTSGRSTAARKVQSARHWSHPCVDGPAVAPDEHLEPRVQVAAEGAVVRDGDAVLGLRVHGQAHAQGESDGVTQDQDPHGVLSVRPRPLQRRMLSAD